MKILAVLFDRFTPIDLIGPANAWMFIPGVQIQLAALEPGPVTFDFGGQIIATHSLDNCFQNPDVLLVPGGGNGPFKAMQNDRFLDHVARLGANASWVTSVCNGSLVLGAAGLLKGYRSACYWYSREYLSMFGAIPVNERVVIDRNRASGGGMTAGIDFGLQMIGIWGGKEAGQLAELSLEYRPQPPFGTGLPELAPPEILTKAKELLGPEMPNELAVTTAKRRRFIPS